MARKLFRARMDIRMPISDLSVISFRHFWDGFRWKSTWSEWTDLKKKVSSKKRQTRPRDFMAQTNLFPKRKMVNSRGWLDMEWTDDIEERERFCNSLLFTFDWIFYIQQLQLYPHSIARKYNNSFLTRSISSRWIFRLHWISLWMQADKLNTHSCHI